MSMKSILLIKGTKLLVIKLYMHPINRYAENKVQYLFICMIIDQSRNIVSYQDFGDVVSPF